MSHIKNLDKKIAVIGAGIAGITTAIGLKKLGFNVTVIYKKRAFMAYEGFSEKTKDGFEMIGCLNAARSLNIKSQRNSNWANISKNVNYEYVTCREDLDESLLKDAKDFDINLIEARVINDINHDRRSIISYKINNEIKSTEVDFVVDARGRFAPFKNEYTNGPKSFSILQELEIPKQDKNKTSIDSIKNGWVWQAYVGKNKGYLQFTCDEKTAHKIKTFKDVLIYLKDEELDLWSLKNYKTKDLLVKRDSYSKVHKTIVNEKMILVGDCASSIDPLSGNGAFQAMSMSSIAPYVINTILNKKENKYIAIEFYKKRVNYIFEKFSNVGKEFYKMETRFSSDFWQKRQSWPDESNKSEIISKIEQGAIVKEGYIEPKEVLITYDNPLGIYFIGNIEIVELAKYCLENSKDKSSKFFKEYTKEFDDNVTKLLNLWLKKYKFI